jgi:hypothetical protein
MHHHRRVRVSSYEMHGARRANRVGVGGHATGIGTGDEHDNAFVTNRYSVAFSTTATFAPPNPLLFFTTNFGAVFSVVRGILRPAH